MLVWWKDAQRRQRGAISIDYVTVVAFVGVLVVALLAAAPGFGGSLVAKVQAVIAGAAGGGGGGSATGPGGVPGAPGGVPGAPGGVPGVPGGIPGVPGSDPLTPGDAFSAGTKLAGVIGGALKIKDGIQLLPWWNAFNNSVRPIADVFGPESSAALRAWLGWQQAASQSVGIHKALSSAAGLGTRADDFVQLGLGSRLLSVAGKVLGPIGVVGGIYGALNSPYSGTRGDIDRTVSLIGAGAAGVGTAAAFGLIALSPPGLIALGAIGIGVAAWGLGNLVWDNREAIGNAIGSGLDWMGDRFSDAGDVLEDFGKGAWDGAQDVASDVGDTITFWD